MNASISPADLRRPGDYKARYERSEYKRVRLEDELRKAQTERDAALYRLQALQALQVKLEAEMRRRGMQTPTQAQQARLGTDFCGAVEMVGIKKASAMMREAE